MPRDRVPINGTRYTRWKKSQSRRQDRRTRTSKIQQSQSATTRHNSLQGTNACQDGPEQARSRRRRDPLVSSSAGLPGDRPTTPLDRRTCWSCKLSAYCPGCHVLSASSCRSWWPENTVPCHQQYHKPKRHWFVSTWTCLKRSWTVDKMSNGKPPTTSTNSAISAIFHVQALLELLIIGQKSRKRVP